MIRREDVEDYGIEIMNDVRVHRIHDNCFRENDRIKKVIIPNNVTKLGIFTFSNCQKLTKVTIPSSITTIPYCCFEHCSQLVEVELSENIKMYLKCFWQCHSLSEKSKERIPDEFIEEQETDDASDTNSDDDEDFDSFAYYSEIRKEI